MKLRITPLNFASAFFLVATVYSWIYGIKVGALKTHDMGTAVGWIFLLFAVVVSFLDLMLRNFFPELKKLWIVELSFITLTAIIFLIVR